MPGKLKVVLGLYAVSLVLNLINQGWVGAALNILVMVFLFKGSDTMRKVVIVFAIIGLVFSVLGILGLLALIALVSAAESAITEAGGTVSGGAGMGDVILLALQVAFGIVSAIYTIWALTRQDVKDWMIAKSSGAAAAG
ncbi:MAG: hypothetical protein KF901_31915 [Myxococcales bacterium]|nr:hypothetical protein [Myxococcales bacterium]